MKVVIYFGHHKVGSTALQGFLARNWRALIGHGILYPAVEPEGLSHALAVALGRAAETSIKQMNVREPHNALAFQMLAQATGGKPPPWHGNLPGVGQMIRALRMQVSHLQPHTVILCSEVLSNFGSGNAALIDKLKDIFPEAEYELYCVLRRPDEYLVSWHGQRLRFGDKVAPLGEKGAELYAKSIHFDYRMLLEPWLEKFPQARHHVRTYSDVLKAGGSAEDFCAVTSVDFPPGLVAAGAANTGIPRASMEIVRRANHDLPQKLAQSLRTFLLDGAAYDNPVPNTDVEIFGRDNRAALAERFAPIHAYLEEATGRRPFFPDLDDIARPRSVPEAEAVRRLLAAVPPRSLPADDALRGFWSELRREYGA